MSWPVNDGVKLALGVVGNITALGLFLVPVKTMYTVCRLRSTEEYSVFPYIMTLLNCLLWTFYGLPIIGEGRTLVITINAVGAGLEAIYVLIFFIFQAPRSKVKTAIYTGLALLFFGTVAAIALAVFYTSESRSLFVGIINDVVTIVMYASPLEIMWLVVRTRSVKYMPFFLSLLAFSNGLAWTVYAIYVRDIFIAIPNAVGMLLGATQLILYALYHHVEVTESRRHMLEKSASEQELSMASRPAEGGASESSESEGFTERMESGNASSDSELGLAKSRNVAL